MGFVKARAFGAKRARGGDGWAKDKARLGMGAVKEVNSYGWDRTALTLFDRAKSRGLRAKEGVPVVNMVE
jgi:hypothetical protein